MPQIDWENFDPKEKLAVNLTSECIESVFYNPATFNLTVYFTDGTVYKYSDVPLHIVTSLVQTASAGRFFNSSIRDVYPVERLE